MTANISYLHTFSNIRDVWNICPNSVRTFYLFQCNMFAPEHPVFFRSVGDEAGPLCVPTRRRIGYEDPVVNDQFSQWVSHGEVKISACQHKLKVSYFKMLLRCRQQQKKRTCFECSKCTHLTCLLFRGAACIWFLLPPLIHWNRMRK